MTSRIVVAYTATKGGKDAVALASRLARQTGATLDLVLVLPTDAGTLVPPDAGFDSYLIDQAQRWLAKGASRVPAGIEHREHVRWGESFAEGLIAAADEFAADFIVVGPSTGAARGHHRLGSTASGLLHSSDVPVVLTPSGERKTDAAAALPRLTVAIGTRPGATALLETAATLSNDAHVPVRLVSLVTVDLPATVDTGVVRIAGAAHADEVLAKAREALPEAVTVDVLVGRGDSIEDAVRNLDWLPGELVLVGSSRLAQPRRLFLGSTAEKMLRELSAPMIVVPRGATSS